MRASLCLLLALALPVGGETLLLKGARVVPVSGPTLGEGDVLIRDGLIAALGEVADVPADAKVLRLRGTTLMPGLIDCASHLGLLYERDEATVPLTPDLRMVETFAPTEDELARALRAGITTILLVPGPANPIGGAASVVKLGPTAASCRVVSAAAGLAVSLSDQALLPLRAPTSRPELETMLRRAFAAVPAQGEELLPPARAGRVPTFIACEESDQAETALELAASVGLKPCLLGLSEAPRLATRLAEAGVPVVLPPFQLLGSAVGMKGVASLSRAGVRFAFGTWSPIGQPLDLRSTASTALRYGLPAEAALRALTADAAEVLGLGERTGSLLVGKEADLVAFSGDPLDLTSRVELVIVDGKIVYQGVER